MGMISTRYSRRQRVFATYCRARPNPMSGSLLAFALLIDPPVELRGAWIASDDLGATPVAEAMQTLADSGINAVFPPATALDRRKLAEIVFEAHRHGLEVLPWFESAEAIVDACRSHDLDGVVLASPSETLKKEVEALGVGLVVMETPKVSAVVPGKGDAVIGWAKLLAEEAALARTLRDERFAEDAQLPWRKEGARRRASPPIEPFAGGGLWTWKSPEGEPRFLAMDGGDVGHASWTFEPQETGNYGLYAWIPAREDLAEKASFKIASAGGMRTIGVDLKDGRNRGWNYIGEARLVAGKSLEVARLEAEEQDATRITAAGPLVVLRSHRPKAR